MKNSKLENSGGRALVLKAFLIFNFAFLISTSRAVDEFGDISVEPGAIYTGNTFHGYAEMRVVMENHSHTKTHYVTLTFPNRNYNGFGNSISRLARTAKLEPEAQVVVSLLQPPLPAQGDNQIHVEIDGRGEGEVHAPNGGNHAAFIYGRNAQPVIFVSRTLDFDAVNGAMQPDTAAPAAPGGGVANPASQAVGEPRAFASGRKDLSAAWMPDWRSSRGLAQWLEVDYTPTQMVEKIMIHSVQSPLRSGSIKVIGISGTNLLTVPMSAAKNVSMRGRGWNVEFNFAATAEPVKTVRIEFGAMPPHAIAIDGVQISSAAGSQWASNARASSENTSFTPATFPPGGYRGGMVDNVLCLRAESAIADWSENWLAYSPFDSIVLNEADLAAMSPAVLNAIGDYLQTGGTVLVLGKNELPATWHSSEKKALADGVEYHVGFGNCFALASENPSTIDPQTSKRLHDLARESALYWQGLPDGSGANNSQPVIENLKIPTRGIVVIMLAFIILIGPVNLIYLNRIKKRTWMLWTIPAISVVTTLLVFIYSLLREGITPDTRIAGLTVLDQATHHAATIGAEAFYCPLTPSGGLKFDYETEATPLVDRGYGPGAAREVDWSQAQNFTRGWVTARVPAHFHLRKPETRRERIQVVNENGQLQIINSLGAPIKTLWYADANLKLFEAHNVAAGEKGELFASTLSSAEKTGASGLLREIGYAARTDSLNNVGKFLTAGTYITVLDGNPFLENALGPASKPLRTKSSSVVFGILEPAETQ